MGCGPDLAVSAEQRTLVWASADGTVTPRGLGLRLWELGPVDAVERLPGNGAVGPAPPAPPRLVAGVPRACPPPATGSREFASDPGCACPEKC